MKKTIVPLALVALGFLTGNLIHKLFFSCVPGKQEVCVYESPYTDEPVMGKKICNRARFWDDCFPLKPCKETKKK